MNMMTYTDERRNGFRDWLRGELRRLDFYNRRGDRYLMSEFAVYATSKGARISEVSLGRWLQDEKPVLPVPDMCRELAKAMDTKEHPVKAYQVLYNAGYLVDQDLRDIMDSVDRIDRIDIEIAAALAR